MKQFNCFILHLSNDWFYYWSRGDLKLHYTRNAVAAARVYVLYATLYEQKRGFFNVPQESDKLKRGETGLTGFSSYPK